MNIKSLQIGDSTLLRVSAASKSEFKIIPGQTWTNGKETFRILRRWGDLFIIKDRFGDEKKVKQDFLMKVFLSKKYYVIPSKNYELFMKAQTALLISYFGFRKGRIISLIFSRFIKKHYLL